MKNKIKGYIEFILRFISFFDYKIYDSCVVMMFHSIQNKKTGLTVNEEMFLKYIRLFIENGFQFIHLSELKNTSDKNKIAILTFDDGYKDNFETVFPILKKYNLPATIFIATDFIGSIYCDSNLNQYVMLDEEQIKEMASSNLVEIGAHTMSHRDLVSLDYDSQKKEILGSIKYLEALINKPIKSFAYPKGKYNQKSIDLLKDTNINIAVTVKPGYAKINLSPYEVERIDMNSLNTMQNLDLIISGKYDSLIRKKNFLNNIFNRVKI